MSIKEEKVLGTDIIFKTKTITCKSFENKIDEKLVLNEDTLYELYNEDGTGINELKLTIKDGKLNMYLIMQNIKINNEKRSYC